MAAILEKCISDQVWGQDGWILPNFFFGVFMDRDEVEVHKRCLYRDNNFKISKTGYGN